MIGQAEEEDICGSDSPLEETDERFPVNNQNTTDRLKVPFESTIKEYIEDYVHVNLRQQSQNNESTNEDSMTDYEATSSNSHFIVNDQREFCGQAMVGANLSTKLNENCDRANNLQDGDWRVSSMEDGHSDRRHRWQRHLLASRSQSSKHQPVEPDKHHNESNNASKECTNYNIDENDDDDDDDDDDDNDDPTIDLSRFTRSIANYKQNFKQQLSVNNSFIEDNNGSLSFCQASGGITNDGLHHELCFTRKLCFEHDESSLIKIQDQSVLSRLNSRANRHVRLAISESVLDMRQLASDVESPATTTTTTTVGNRLSYRISLSNKGSLSDSSYQYVEDKQQAFYEMQEVEERLRNWKKSNRLAREISEDPFKMHADRLKQFSRNNSVETADGYSQSDGDQTIALKVSDGGFRGTSLHQHDNQDEHLQNYASHLSYLYKNNQTIMDNNNDFRALLYSIICCLLIQDEQVLGTPSVTKMIHVIRTHLESASKFYSAAILSASQKNSLSLHGELLGQVEEESKEEVAFNLKQQGRDESRPNLVRGIGRGEKSACHSAKCSRATNLNQSVLREPQFSDDSIYQNSRNVNITGNSSNCKQKPVEFRRISSVSYNDEQLINDLCDTENCVTTSSELAQDKTLKQPESPWRYEELSSAYHQTNRRQQLQTASESSLDTRNSTTFDFMNDSGIGTIYDFRTDDFSSNKINSKGTSKCRKRHSLASDFKPKQNQQQQQQQQQQQPRQMYLSTDADYLSQSMTEDSQQSGGPCSYDCESSNLTCIFNEQRPVDVASRRAELEWTLNKLINFELKYTWLTGQDTLRRAIRKIGVPNEIRGKVWLILIEQMIGSKYDAAKLLTDATKTIEAENASSNVDEELHSILKQIELDVNRTMPGHKLFDDGAEGGVKLRRILVAYSIHINRAIAYCQGFNFIVALLLSVFEGDEEKSLRGFVCIVDHIFPSKFYFDHYLTGARADQFLLADFICNQLIKNPTLAERRIVEGVTSSITLNWFISLFHGAVPTLTRLTILDHFMLDGVKALFRFTMAILYLAFQVTPPSSCEVFSTIRNTAKDMYDIKLLLSIVEQIKLPKDSYFAIRRSFYMVQSSFNSDQFYMQSLSNDASRQFVTNKPLSLQQLPETKPPAMSLITAASIVAQQSIGINGDYQLNFNANNNTNSGLGALGPRACTSSDRSKVCIQNIGKLGRSHIRIIDANCKSNERSLMSPLRNCLVIGISNCGKNVIVARQSSRRVYKTFREQDLTFHVHELNGEIFDGFYIEDNKIALILTYLGEIFKIDTTKCFADNLTGSTETLMLRDSHPIGDSEKVKLKLASVDSLTNLLWVCIECEETTPVTKSSSKQSLPEIYDTSLIAAMKSRYKPNNPFLCDLDDTITQKLDSQSRCSFQKKILIIDIITFDIFSALTVHESFGDIIKMRTSLVSFCQLANPMSNQFSSRIVRIGPTGRYEHLLSFADVVDFMITVPESCSKGSAGLEDDSSRHNQKSSSNSSNNNKCSTFNKLLARSISFNGADQDASLPERRKSSTISAGTLTRYYRSLMKSRSTEQEGAKRDTNVLEEEDSTNENPGQRCNKSVSGSDHSSLPRALVENPCRAIITSYLGDIEDIVRSNYIPVNMAFIFRNGKIALFEFTESYVIHTRESQLDRYDYSKVIDVSKNGNDFIVTILTIFDKLIKVVI